MIAHPYSLIIVRFAIFFLCIQYVLLYQIEKMHKTLSTDRQYDSLNKNFNKNYIKHSLYVKYKQRV